MPKPTDADTKASPPSASAMDPIPRPARLAAIDIGTNSIRSIVVEVDARGRFHILDDEKATVRLGEGLAATGAISAAAWERARAALERMTKIFSGYGVRAVEAVATSAVRKATNGPQFIAAMARETGVEITVISGEEEAELAALSARYNFEMENVRYALVDIGGGSAEVVTTFGHHIEEIFSMELGAVVLTERFLPGDPVTDEELRQLRRHVRVSLKEALGNNAPPVQSLIGSGGTMTTIAAMVMAQRKEQFDSLQGYEVLRSEIVHLLAMLQRRPLKERRSVSGLNPERADIIIAGMAVVDEMLRFFDCNILKVNEQGVRQGMILKSLEKHGLLPLPEAQRDWRSSVLEFARACHFNEDHAEQVTQLALALFDAVAPAYGLSERDRQLLEAGALLHDVGYLISYDRHHKHSYHLIRHAHLFGFTPREKLIIANIARYHRKALPKKKHDNLHGLSPDDIALVARLGGILRLADGLDRRRSNVVQKLHCALGDRELHLALEGAGEDLAVELYGASTKGDLFEKAFDRRVVLEKTES